jgi:hypothetical protein
METTEKQLPLETNARTKEQTKTYDEAGADETGMASIDCASSLLSFFGSTRDPFDLFARSALYGGGGGDDDDDDDVVVVVVVVVVSSIELSVRILRNRDRETTAPVVVVVFRLLCCAVFRRIFRFRPKLK